MFFEYDEDEAYSPETYHMGIYALNSRMRKLRTYGLRNAPTHTEDGIPIRKLYVSNLPPKTKRTELFAVFAQYGFIKSCWLRMDVKGPNQTPTYAFVTFGDAADAHRALRAPSHEKTLRGRTLRISPADSWHQPTKDVDGKKRFQSDPTIRPRDNCRGPISFGIFDAENNETRNDVNEAVEDEDCPQSYTILDILNSDCLSHILTYVPIRDLIRSERVSKRWQEMIQEYLKGVRMFKTSWWQHVPVTLTTAVLRRVLARLGGALLRLHIDHHCSALNDRTAHTVGKFCPHLEELTIVCMHTKNWNPLIYGCKQLKSLSFISCNKLTDTSLVQLVKSNSPIESLTVANNTHVTGLFLTGSEPSKLSSLSFHNCYSLQATVLGAALHTMPGLTALRLDDCPIAVWKIVPSILSGLPGLRELSLSGYSSVARTASLPDEEFSKSLSGLAELKVLNLSKNVYVTNSVLKTVGRSCPKLESLDVSSCNGARGGGAGGVGGVGAGGVGDEGVRAACACSALRRLDVSYLAALTDAGLAAAALLPRLARLLARGNRALSSAPFAAAVAACPLLRELDACGCDAVGDDLLGAAAAALAARPRPLVLRLAATAAAAATTTQELESHPLLLVDLVEDLCDPLLRSDFVDQFLDGSDGSYDDLYEEDHYDDFFVEDEPFEDEYDYED